MPRRQSAPPQLPVVWLMTDERVGDALWEAVERLPPGAGIVFRHYATPLEQRRILFARLARIAQARTLLLVRGGDDRLADEEAGVHGAGAIRAGAIRTWPAHDRAEALAGKAAGADLLFVAPVFPTRSHPGARALGLEAAAEVIRGLSLPAIALGGMNAQRFAALKPSGFYGWAAIDAWLKPPAA